MGIWSNRMCRFSSRKIFRPGRGFTVENCNQYSPAYTGQSSCLEADMGHFVDEYGATEQAT